MAHPKPTNGAFDYPARVGNAIDALDRRLKGNLLDNGAFQIWQRGTSFAAAGSNVFACDRWHFYRAAFAVGATLSRQTGSQAQYCARVQRDNGNAATGAVNFAQSIESINSIPLRSRYLTLTFRARMGANYSPTSAALTASVLSGTGTDESVVSGFTGQATVATSTVTLTTSWQDFTLTAATAGASITQLGVLFQFTPTGTAGAADYAEIEEVQLVHGEYAGIFPYKTIADELANCQRFYVKSFPIVTAPAQNMGNGWGELVFPATKAGAAAQIAQRLLVPVRMRAAPTVTFYNPGAANAQARDTTAAGDCSSTSATNTTDNGFTINTTGNAGTAVGNILSVGWVATADI